MREALIALCKVKTLITLAVTAALVGGFFLDKIQTEVFVPFVSMVLTYYFRKGKEE